MTRAYDVAWFWRVSPATVLGLELAEFLEWEAHARRIAEILGPRARED